MYIDVLTRFPGKDFMIPTKTYRGLCFVAMRHARFRFKTAVLFHLKPTTLGRCRGKKKCFLQRVRWENLYT